LIWVPPGARARAWAWAWAVEVAVPKLVCVMPYKILYNPIN